MEHTSLPSNCSGHSVKIPLLATEEYDRGDFLTYPDRAGWREAISERTWKRDPNPFIQTWLFFGLISTIFGRKATFREFTLADSSGSIITTEPLQDRHKWCIDTTKQKYLRQRDLERAITCLREARKMFYTFLQMSFMWEIVPELALSISTTGEFLHEIVFDAFLGIIPINPADGSIFTVKFVPRSDCWNTDSFTTREIADSLAKFSSFTNQDWGNRSGNSYPYKQMREKGWCKKKAFRCMAMFSGTAAYFASHFDNPSSRRDHSLCTHIICSANNLDESRYQTLHTQQECICEHVGASEADLSSILANKFFPVVGTVDGRGDNAVLSLKEFYPGMRFVAISHVWSDGFGNPNANSLPHCQLSHIGELARQLCGTDSCHEIPFWIDTICCPVQSGKAQDLAITKMKDTYSSAEWVLVIDSWLTSQTVGGLPDGEILLKIACSNWNERLWTLQEGIIARKLAFQFRDTVFQDFGRAVEEIWAHPEPTCRGLRGTLLSAYGYLYGLKNMGEREENEKLLTLRDTLKFRDTSVPSDEALCLGTLLGYDLSPIVGAAKEDRMRVFWSTFTRIPSQFVFGGGERLHQKGYGWAPKTLRHLYVNGAQMPDSPFCYLMRAAQSLPSSPSRILGLQVHATGFLLTASRHALWDTFVFFDVEGNLYGAECNPRLSGFPAESSTADPSAPRGRQERVNPWGKVGKLSPKCIAIISAYSSDLTGRFPVDDAYNALLVAVYKQRDEILVTKFVRPVHLSFEKEPAFIQLRRFELSSASAKERSGSCVLDEDCIWIISGARSVRNQAWLIT